MEWLVSTLLLFKSSSKFKWKYPVLLNIAMYNSLWKIWRTSVTQNFFPSVCVLSSLAGGRENIGGCNYFQHTCEYWTGVLLEYHTQNVNPCPYQRYEQEFVISACFAFRCVLAQRSNREWNLITRELLHIHQMTSSAGWQDYGDEYSSTETSTR